MSYSGVEEAPPSSYRTAPPPIASSSTTAGTSPTSRCSSNGSLPVSAKESSSRANKTWVFGRRSSCKHEEEEEAGLLSWKTKNYGATNHPHFYSGSPPKEIVVLPSLPHHDMHALNVEAPSPLNNGLKHHHHHYDDDDGATALYRNGHDFHDDDEPTLTDHPMDPFESHVSSKISMLPLAVMVFYSVSGGPFGVEASVRSAGNFYTLLGFLVMPWVWSVQEALMTAELGTAFPEASGGVAWVETAFGTSAGWMAGYLGWVAGATDNAIYPVLFLDYVLQAFWSHGRQDDDEDPTELHPVMRMMLLSSVSIGLAYVNWLGLPLVGKMSVSICFVAMSPFIILTLIGSFKVDPSRWFEMPDQNRTAIEAMFDDDHIEHGLIPIPGATMGGVLWRPLLNNLFWNLNSFDAAGSFAADVENPGQVLPRAMMWSVFLVVIGYFIPLLVALGASEASQEEWVDGYLAKACSEIVGPWLGAWTVFAAGISNIALFQAELSADAFQLMGMADRGYLPKVLATRSRHGTPTYGIMIGTAIIVAMGVSDLEGLIEMLNFNYAISLLMEYCAFIKLRISRPDLHRPWRVPLNTFGCIVCLIPTFLFTFLILALATPGTYLFCLVINILGVGIYVCRQPNAKSLTKELCQSVCSRKSYDRVGTDAASLDSTTGTTGSPPSFVVDDAASVSSLPSVS